MSESIAIDWQKNWDAEVGLWWVDGPGHTRDSQTLTRRHVVAAGGGALLIAGQLGELGRIDTGAILRAIRAKQIGDSGHRRFGNICWHWEDTSVQDSNAGFFLGQSLAVVALEYAAQMQTPSRELLADIVRDLAVCMKRDARESSAYYPNKHLGDIVVAHLLTQATGHDDGLAELDDKLAALADSYLSHGWGWGEDMSDIYSKILLDEVSLFLCVSRRLSDAVRAACVRMLHHLIKLDDLFAGGPRVPAIRTYDFLESPGAHPRRHYREIVSPWKAGAAPPISHVPQAGPLLYERGWHALVPPRAEREREVAVRFVSGRSGHARIEDDFRAGCVSRFPLMDSAEHHDWGLAWQCMPVTASHAAGDWAFLQWFTQTAGNPAAHPAMVSHKTDPTRVFRALSPSVSPPLIGRTHALLRGGGIVAMRILPAVSRDWELAGDRFRIVAPTAALSEDLSDAAWPRLTMGFPGRSVGVSLIDPWRRSRPLLTRGDQLADWTVALDQRQIASRRGIVLLWAIHPDGLPDAPPVITPHGGAPIPRSDDELAFDFDWQWPGHRWRLTLDPLSQTPLVEVS